MSALFRLRTYVCLFYLLFVSALFIMTIMYELSCLISFLDKEPGTALGAFYIYGFVPQNESACRIITATPERFSFS
jgi:hypothetical protein